ncbi:MAG: methyl-accepting chemotaxis protein [Myxococcales bacterium]|nr:methyl-accepting chemotaxis protein [Myxococcales bacterium]
MRRVTNGVGHPSIMAQVLLPALLLLTAVTLITLDHLATSSRDNAIETATRNATRTIRGFRTLRGYYTRNVVKPVKASGALSVHYEHGQDGAIPLPATMIHELSEELSQQQDGIELKLFSRYPFPNRASRKLDEYQRQALDYLERSPEETFVRVQEMNGRTVVRVAQADTLQAQACVGCHNSHPETPRTGWALGDVRGVLEVAAPIESDLRRNDALVKQTERYALLGYGILAIFVALVLYVIRRRLRVVRDFAALTATGDLSRAIESAKWRDEVGVVRSSFSTMVSNLRNLVQSITRASTSVRSKSSEIQDGLAELSRVTENGAAAVHQTSAATEQMTATVDQNAENARVTHELTLRTAEKARSGRGTLSDAVDAMNDLADTSSRVSDIVSMVDEIAFQTNMLALNAAVEAARAGEHGRGFAVVATEVRRLSARTSAAADEIQQLVRASEHKTRSAQQQVEVSGKVFDEIAADVESISQSASEIAAATREQATGIEEVNKAVVMMDQLVSSSTAMIGEVSGAANAMGADADDLARSVAMFKLPNRGTPANSNAAGPMDKPATVDATTLESPNVGDDEVDDPFASLPPKAAGE